MNARQLKEKQIIEQVVGRQLSRREFLRMVTIGSAGAILAACGAQATDAPAAPTDVPAAPEPTAVPTAAGPTRGGVLRVTLNQGLGTLDPHKFTFGAQHNGYPMFWNALVYIDANAEVAGDLAESWERVDPTHWKFALRQGVLFHNGRECTAEDVKFSLDRILDPDTGSAWAGFISVIDEVVVEDKYTLGLTLSKANGSLLESLADCRVVAEENLDDIATNPIGTGPFRVKEIVPDEFYEGERFPDYFREGLPYLDGAKVIRYRDTQAAMAALKTGDADIVWSSPTTFDAEFTADPNFELVQQVIPTYQVFCIYDCSGEPFNDIRVRQAVRYACDSDAIGSIAYVGRGESNWTNNMFPMGHWAYNPNLPKYSFDLDKAKELFDEAGIAPGTTYIAPTLDECCPELTAQMEIMAANLAKIDINLQLDNMEPAAWADIFTPSGKEWPGIFAIGGALPTYTPGSLLAHVITDRGNWDRVDEVKTMLDDAEAAPTQDERVAKLWEIQEIITEEVPVLISIHQKFTHVRAANVQGLYLDLAGNLKYQDVHLEA